MKKIFVATAFLLHAMLCGANLKINELMQSNIDCVVDDLNEFPDSWVELYNPSAVEEPMMGYSIGLSADPEEAYSIAVGGKVVAKGFVMVYCDKVGNGLHAPFRIDSGKGASIYLFKDGTVVDKVENLKKQPAPNIAYGRQSEDSDTWGYQASPTPAMANCNNLVSKILGEPVFSVKGKVMTSTASLTLSLPDGAPQGTVIRYTTDGGEPTAQSKNFAAPIPLTSTKVIRAKLFCEGYMSPRATVHTYLFAGRDITVPVVSIVCPDGYFYDNQFGIYVKGTYDASTPNYRYDWRRPVNIEYFEAPNQEAVINQLCETRVKGGWTRDFDIKSLAVYANKRFGTKRLAYEFFKADRPGITDFKSLELRNAGNDFDGLYMRDAIIQRMAGPHCDLDWQSWQPTAVFLNGKYLAMLNLRERSNEDNIYTHYNGLEDVDMVENWSELKEGTIDSFNEFVAFYTEKGHTAQEYLERMDVTEFLNYMILNIFVVNRDFPGNNLMMWRPQVEGGRWRWICKDTDFGLGLYSASAQYKYLNWLYDNNFDQSSNTQNKPQYTRLFRRLMDIDEFKNEFIERMAVYVGDFMNARCGNALIDDMYAQIKTEYTYHRSLINPWWPNYANELSNVKSWLTTRTTFIYDHMNEFWGLGTPTPLTINKTSMQDMQISVNGVSLSNRVFDGKYFAGRKLNVTGVPADELMEVVGWRVSTQGAGGTSTVYREGWNLVMDMPLAKAVGIEPVVAERSGINQITVDGEGEFDPGKPYVVYDLTGREMPKNANLMPGVYLFKQGQVSKKVIIRAH